MKKILLILLLFATSLFYAQNGITYQAVIYKPNGDATPGFNNTNVPLALRNICIQFSIVDNSNQTEYQENITTTTDKFGMVNLLIGSGNQVGGYATSFNNINWNTTVKSLVVNLDISGNCTNFEEISNQPFSVVPFAYNSFNATNATNITGIVPIANGGTNGTTVQEAKTNLNLDQVDNTSDLNKPISTATQTALNTKENSSNKSNDVTLADVTNTKFPTELAVKTFVNGQVTTATNNATTAIAAVQADVDQNELDSDAADATLQTNINTLTSTVGTNATTATTAIAAVQADVDANETAANAAIALKEDAVNKSTDVTLADATNTKFPTELAVKTFVNGQVTTATNNATSAIAAVQADVDANETAANAAIALKEDAVNKSTDVTLADATNTKFPTELAVKTFVNGQVTTATNNATSAIAAVQADVDANETAANAAIALKEDAVNKSTDVTLADATNTKFPTELAVKTFVNGQVTTVSNNATSAIAAVQADVDANETAANAAIALKEDAVNKSTDVTLADATNTKFPTELAVKSYVDGQVTTATNNATSAIAAVQADVDANETAANAAIALKEDAVNKSTDVTLADATNTKFPTELAVKSYVDGQITTVGSNFLPLTGGTITGQLFAPSVVFNNGSTWQVGNSGLNFSIYQGGCCSRVIIDDNGNFGIGGNYLPQFKLDVEGDGRFTNNVTANAFSIPSGAATQFLKADGSIDSNSYFIASTTNVAIGYVSGSGGQGDHSVAIGSNTAQGAQAEGGVAVGYAAAQYNQGTNAVALGSFAGNSNQPENAVAIGYNAQTNGINSIAIGAGAVAQNANTIQLGDSNITNVNTSGSITANAEISPEITNNITINLANAEQYKGKVLICNPSSQITITFENNLPVGFNCMVLQKSDEANKINFAGGSGVTLKNRNNFTATAGNYAIATIVNIGGGIIVTAGDMQ